MKNLIYLFCTLVSFNFVNGSFAADSASIVPGLYITAANFCDMYIVQDGEELIFESVSSPKKPTCLDRGEVFRVKRDPNNPNQFKFNDFSWAKIIGNEQVLFQRKSKDGVITDYALFHLYKIPSFKPLTEKIRATSADLFYRSADHYAFYYQALAGVGNCKIIECEDDTLGFARAEHASCTAKLNQSLANKMPNLNAYELSKKLFNRVQMWGYCGNK